MQLMPILSRGRRKSKTLDVLADLAVAGFINPRYVIAIQRIETHAPPNDTAYQERHVALRPVGLARRGLRRDGNSFVNTTASPVDKIPF